MWSTKILRNSKKKGAAFTIIELLFVVIVIAILAAAGIAMYIRSLDKARASEGLAILSSVRTHFLVEWAEKGAIPDKDETNGLAGWGIDTTKNKWWIEGTGFTTRWDEYTTGDNFWITLVGADSGVLKDIALSIECPTGEIVQDYDYGG